jgi:hypothetical protein
VNICSYVATPRRLAKRIAATGAGVPPVEHEFLRAQSGQPGLFVKGFRLINEIGPTVGGVNINLDDAGVGRDLDLF